MREREGMKKKRRRQEKLVNLSTTEL